MLLLEVFLKEIHRSQSRAQVFRIRICSKPIPSLPPAPASQGPYLGGCITESCRFRTNSLKTRFHPKRGRCVLCVGWVTSPLSILVHVKFAIWTALKTEVLHLLAPAVQHSPFMESQKASGLGRQKT